MPKLQQTYSKKKPVYSITVPKSLVKLKGWEKGDIIEFIESDGKVCLENLSKR